MCRTHVVILLYSDVVRLNKVKTVLGTKVIFFFLFLRKILKRTNHNICDGQNE